ncbi:MAG: DUF2306 domain-containing protein [Pseudomonadota bacterium]
MLINTLSTSDIPFRKRLSQLPWQIWMVAISVLIYSFVYRMIASEMGWDFAFQPRLDPLLAADAVTQIHVGAAIMTFLIGSVIMALPKGVGLHKTLGWSWVIGMALTAGSSFLMTGLFENSYSPIHALSAYTLLGLPFGIAAARRRKIKAHREQMTSMFVGAMVIAGLFTFLPGRLMWSMLFVT